MLAAPAVRRTSRLDLVGDVLNRAVVVAHGALVVAHGARVLARVDPLAGGQGPGRDEVADGAVGGHQRGEVLARVAEVVEHVERARRLRRPHAENARARPVAEEDVALRGAPVDPDGQVAGEALCQLGSRRASRIRGRGGGGGRAPQVGHGRPRRRRPGGRLRVLPETREVVAQGRRRARIQPGRPSELRRAGRGLYEQGWGLRLAERSRDVAWRHRGPGHDEHGVPPALPQRRSQDRGRRGQRGRDRPARAQAVHGVGRGVGRRDEQDAEAE